MTLDPGQRLVRLVAPRGTDEANFGTTAYRVADDGNAMALRGGEKSGEADARDERGGHWLGK